MHLSVVLAFSALGVLASRPSAPWPCRAGGPERQGYQRVQNQGKGFDQFDEAISPEQVCGFKEYGLVNDIAISSDGHVVASTGESVASLSRIGQMVWSFGKGYNTTYSQLPGEKDPLECLFFTSPVIGLIEEREVVFVGTGNPIAQTHGPRGDLPLHVFAIGEDGKLVWATELPSGSIDRAKVKAVQCTDVVLDYTSEHLYVACSFDADVFVHQLDAATGKILQSETKAFAYVTDPPVKANPVGELLVSKWDPKSLLLTTQYQFFLSPTFSLSSSWNITYPSFAASFRLAESWSGTVLVYTYDIVNNTVYTVDRARKVFTYTQVAGDSKYEADGALSLNEGNVFALEMNQLVCLNITLGTVWVAKETTKSSPGSGLAVDSSRVYVFDGSLVQIFSQEKPGNLVASMETQVKFRPVLNPFRSPAISSGSSPAFFLPSGNRVVSLSLGNNGPVEVATPSGVPLEPSLSGGTIAAIVVTSCILGTVLFAGIWYFNSQRENYNGRLPLI